MSSSKNQLRAILKHYRGQYSESAWTAISNAIQSHVIKLVESLNPDSIGCYLQSSRTREVHTDLIVSHFLSKSTFVYVPVTGEDHSMRMVLINPETRFVENQWGIREPIGPGLFHEIVPDVIVVPMLGSAYTGYRIGYGKGYYDRYLTGKRVTKIGVCPHSCILHQIPTDDHDIPMDYLITENGIVRKNAN